VCVGMCVSVCVCVVCVFVCVCVFACVKALCIFATASVDIPGQSSVAFSVYGRSDDKPLLGLVSQNTLISYPYFIKLALLFTTHYTTRPLQFF